LSPIYSRGESMWLWDQNERKMSLKYTFFILAQFLIHDRRQKVRALTKKAFTSWLSCTWAHLHILSVSLCRLNKDRAQQPASAFSA
jgi:hypothetical protein